LQEVVFLYAAVPPHFLLLIKLQNRPVMVHFRLLGAIQYLIDPMLVIGGRFGFFANGVGGITKKRCHSAMVLRTGSMKWEN
jgi:hypothetical protein